MKKIAVVILNWNGAKLLEQFLPSVMVYSDEAKIYVADNASTDNSIAVLKEKFPLITIIQNDRNYGFASGYNSALQQVEEEYYALVNSDIEVTKNWLTPILSIFDSNPNVAIIQPKKLRHVNCNDQKDETSSIENNTPPTGAPNAAATPHAEPSAIKSRRSRSVLNLFIHGKSTPKVFERD